MKDGKIPKEFYSYDTGKPFKKCMICQEDLIDPPKHYIVEKSIKRYPEMDHTDVIYEYAMCMGCVMKQQEFISQESLQNMMEYMQNLNFNIKIRMEMKEEEVEDEKIPTTCSVHQTSVEDMTEYVIQGTFKGNQRDTSIPMLLFGSDALEEMQELLSYKTREGMDDFMDRWFSGPPEFRELLRERKTVLI